MSKIKGAIFDFDGTIYDSMEYWQTISYDFLKSRFNIIDEKIDSECETYTIEEAVNYMNKKHSLNIKISDIYDFFDEGYTKLKAKKRIVEIIENYYNNNVKMIIATVTTKSLVLKSLKNLGLEKYFIDYITVEEIGKSKKYPDIYNECLKRLNLSKKEIVVYEDSSYAITTLINNNFNVIGVKDIDDLSKFNIEVI